MPPSAFATAWHRGYARPATNREELSVTGDTVRRWLRNGDLKGILISRQTGYRVIRVDNRGAGRTGDVPGAPYTVETMAADCLAVLDAADVDTAHIVGISMGGLTAQEIVLTASERVRSLCLIATHPGIAHAVSGLALLRAMHRMGTRSRRCGLATHQHRPAIRRL